MKPQHTAPSKRGRRIKPVLVTLVCLVLVVAAALLPGAAVRLQDRQLYDAFQPLGRVGGTLALTAEEDEALQLLDVFLDSPDIYEDTPHVPEVGTEYHSLAIEQLADMQAAGLIPEDTAAYFSNYLQQNSLTYDIEYRAKQTDAGEIVWLSANGQDVITWLNCYLCRTYAQPDYKLLTLDFQIPADLAAPPEDPSALLGNYMKWLGVASFDDWQVREEKGGPYVEASATSLSCNLRIAIGYSFFQGEEYTNGKAFASYSFSVSRMIQG